MTQAYYFSDFMTDVANDYISTVSEIKQALKNYVNKSKINFYKTIKSVSDKFSMCLERLIESPAIVSRNLETKITIDDVVENMLGNYSFQSNVGMAPVIQTSDNTIDQGSVKTIVEPQSYVLPKQYTRAVKIIGVNESENNLTEILLGTKKELKTWDKRINELGMLSKKYSAQVIDKYKFALRKNSYLRYKKKSEYLVVLTSLEALKA